MNPLAEQQGPCYVTCPCQHCSGNIEFDACALEEGETRTVPCPHCELETVLSIPEERVPPVIRPLLPTSEPEEDSAAEYALVLNWWRRAAEQGYAKYQVKWAVALANGLGAVAKDDSGAVDWFRKAAEQGDAQAQYSLGVHCWTGQGVEANRDEGLKWFRKAAEQGYALAQCHLAACYWEGQELAKDPSEMAKLLLKAAEQGHADAQYDLAACYWNGHGVPKDHSEGVKWLLKAAEQSVPLAQSLLAACYEEGDGVVQNLVEAYKWAMLAAAQNADGALKRSEGLVSKMSQNQIAESRKLIEAFKNKSVADPVLKPREESLMDLWRRLAEDGDIEAQQLLAARCENKIEAMKWVRKSAEQGSYLAQYRLGAAHVAGEGVRQDFVEAVRWWRKAAEKQFAPAIYELGLAFYHGLGVPQNYVEAYKFASIAAARGLPNARTLRDELAEKMSPRQIAQGQRLAAEKGERGSGRDAIPSEVRREVWRRDNGQCVKCGSREKLEYDHIIPVVRGGSNTARNIELLCETCNRSKSASIQ